MIDRVAVVLLWELDGAMVTLQDGRYVDVNVVREFWNGAKSARCRFLCERAPRVNFDVMANACEKTRTNGRNWREVGANCAHSHSLLIPMDER